MLPQRNVNCFAAPLHSAAADRAYIVCMEWDRLGRRDNHDDPFASPAYLPCIAACTLVFTHSPTPLAVFCCWRPLALRAVQTVIMWTAPLTDNSASGVTAEKNIARYRYYPIHANIAQYPIVRTLLKTGLLSYAVSAARLTHQRAWLCLQWRSTLPYWRTWSLVHYSKTMTWSIQSHCQTLAHRSSQADPSNLYGDVPVVSHPPPGFTRSAVTRVSQRQRPCS